MKSIREDPALSVDRIRRQFHLSLKQIAAYHRDHKDEIDTIETILSEDNKAPEKLQALLLLFSNPSSVPEEYRLPLLSALVYRPNLYAMALNYQGALASGLEGPAISVEKRQRRRSFKRPYVSRALLAAACMAAALVFILLPMRRTAIEKKWTAAIEAPPLAAGESLYQSGYQGVRLKAPSPLLITGTVKDSKLPDPERQKKLINNYSQAIMRDMNNSALYVDRGAAFTAAGFLDSAIRDFNTALTLDPGNSSARYNLALALMGKGNGDEALAELEALLKANLKDAGAHYAMGSLYYAMYENSPIRPQAYLDKAINAFQDVKHYQDAGKILDYLKSLKPGPTQ
jgi:hypothetical protein